MPDLPLSIRILATLAFMALLVAASVIPGEAQPGDSVFIWAVALTPSLLQKSLHVVLYAVLTMLWIWTLDVLSSRTRSLVIAALVATTFGAALEWYQTQVPGRFGTILDVGVNAAGVLIGLAAAIRADRTRKMR